MAHGWVLVVLLVFAVLVGVGRLYDLRQRARWETVRARSLRCLAGLDARGRDFLAGT